MRHATTSSSHFSLLFLFLSWRRNHSKSKFKSGLTERGRCEGLNMAPLPKILSWGKRREGTISCSEVFNVMTEKVKQNLSAYCLQFSTGTAWFGFTELGLAFKLSFKSEGYWGKSIHWRKHRLSTHVISPHCEYLYCCILSSLLFKFQVSLLLCIYSFTILSF